MLCVSNCSGVFWFNKKRDPLAGELSLRRVKMFRLHSANELSLVVIRRVSIAFQGKWLSKGTMGRTPSSPCRSALLTSPQHSDLRPRLPVQQLIFITNVQVKDYPGLLRVVSWVLNGLELVVKKAK